MQVDTLAALRRKKEEVCSNVLYSVTQNSVNFKQ